MSRVLPNILITGTPGTGKTTLAQEISTGNQLNFISVSDYAKENDLISGYDDALQCPILDEDQLIDELEDTMSSGGNVVEYHSSDFFPERWFDIVFVLRTDNTLLHSRLTERRYNEEKIKNNMECEIFQTALDEARESYKEDIVHELQSNVPEDMERNLDQISSWISQFR